MPALAPVLIPVAANGIKATGGLLAGAAATGKVGAIGGIIRGLAAAAALLPIAGAFAPLLPIPIVFPDPEEPEPEPAPETEPVPGLDPGLNPPITFPDSPPIEGDPQWFAGLVSAKTDWKPAVYDQYWCGGNKFGTTSGGNWQTLSSYTPRSNRSRIFRIRLFPEWITGRSCTEDTSYDHEVSIIEEWEADGSNRYETIATREAGLRGPSTWYGQGVNEGRIRDLVFEPMPEVPEPGPIAPPAWDPDPAPEPEPEERPSPIIPLPLAPPTTIPVEPDPIIVPVPEVEPVSPPSPDNPDAPPITIPRTPPAEPVEVPTEVPGPSPSPYPIQPGVVPLPSPLPGLPPITEPDPDPQIQPAPQPAPNPVPAPGPVPIPDPGTNPEPLPGVVPDPNTWPNPNPQPGVDPDPNQFPDPITPGTPGPGPIVTPVTPENPQLVDPGTGVVPLPVPGPRPTPPTHHFPIPGAPAVTPGGQRPTLPGIGQEVGRIEQKTANIGNRVGGILDSLGDLADIIELINFIKDLFEQPLPAKTYTLNPVCEEEAEPTTVTLPAEMWADRLVSSADVVPELLQAHLGYKTPICRSNNVQGEWRTIHFVSEELSAGGKRHIDRRFRYRSLGGGSLDSLIDYWKDFTWTGGPVIVKHLDAWWGTPQVWASSGDEGKRVIRHAAGEAGIDPDQVGRWQISGVSNPRYGVPCSLKVNTKGGYYWITARDGASQRPLVAKSPPAP